MNRVFITSVGQARIHSAVKETEIDLAKKAVDFALLDGGLLKSDIQTTHWVPAADVPDLAVLGLSGSVLAVTEPTSPGARVGKAFQQAYDAILAGRNDVVLVLRSGMLDCPETLAAVREQIHGINHASRVLVDAFRARLQSNGCGDGLFYPSVDCAQPLANCRLLNNSAAAMILCSRSFFERLDRPTAVEILASTVGSFKPAEETPDELVHRLVNQAYAEGHLDEEGLSLEDLVFPGDCSDDCLAGFGSFSNGSCVGSNNAGNYEGVKEQLVQIGSDAFGLSRGADLVTWLRNAEHGPNPGVQFGVALTGTLGSAMKKRHIGVHVFKKISGRC